MALHSETRPSDATPSMTGFHHGALLYEGANGFLRATTPFIRDGIDAGEPVLVAAGKDKIALLCAELGDQAEQVEFADMAVLGRNPARIIPAWRDFVVRHEGSAPAVRGIGEPIWAGRSAAELAECQRHEALLNVAFTGATAPSLTLMCPYDVGTLSEPVLSEAARSHPLVKKDGSVRPDESAGIEQLTQTHLHTPLPEPSGCPREMEFGLDELHTVRGLVTVAASAGGLGPERSYDLALAASEVATNSVVHGGGTGIFRAWSESGGVVCEFRDQGKLDDPLVGREEPLPDGLGRRGLWMVNQLCDLVQIRVFASGTVVRLHMLPD
ncbi:MAG: sensor histidine kinase [Nocardioidaceae bacterium]